MEEDAEIEFEKVSIRMCFSILYLLIQNLRSCATLGDEDTADWSKSDSSNGWDDSGNLGDALAFDLADMSAAALKFQSETLNLSSFNDPSKVEAEDVEEDETELPEWAEEDVMPINRNENMSAEASNKRNLLMGVSISRSLSLYEYFKNIST